MKRVGGQPPTLCRRGGRRSWNLKRSIGADLIVVEVDGDDPTALDRLRRLPEVETVARDDQRLTLSTRDSAAALGPVMMELAHTSLQLHGLTLCRPTLDDVFKKLTGSHLDDQESAA